MFNFGQPQSQRGQRQQPLDPLSAMFGGFVNMIGNSIQLPGFMQPQQPAQSQQQPRQRQQQPQPQQRPSQPQQQRPTQPTRPNSQQQRQQPHPQPPSPNHPHRSNSTRPNHKPTAPASQPATPAHKLKQKGNAAFQQGDYKTALDFYTGAISLDNTQSVFFSNRARCFKLLNRFDQALQDTQTAIELDEKNIKAHLLAGQILAEVGKNDKDVKRIESAITRLKKALTLCSGQKKTEFQAQLNIYINRARKLLWYKQYDILRNHRISAIKSYKNYLESDPNLNSSKKQQRFNDFITVTNQTVQLQIPDCYSCRITLDLMRDPVVTDTGQSYEREVIEQHILRNGKTDPITREPITGRLYPNLALKKAIGDFIQKNPWAYQFKQNQDYRQIPF